MINNFKYYTQVRLTRMTDMNNFIVEIKVS